MRREQIFKLVLNQNITVDFNMSPMQGSPKAFSWAGMNYSEEGSALEQLAVRFGKEELATAFRRKIDESIEALKRGDLEPEED